MRTINYLSDNYVDLSGPINESTGAAVGTVPTSCTLRVFNERKETRTSTLETRLVSSVLTSSNTVYLPKMNPAVVRAGDLLRFYSSDDSVREGTVVSVLTTDTFADRFVLAAPIGGFPVTTIDAGAKVITVRQAASAVWLHFDDEPKFQIGDTIELYQDNRITLNGAVTQIQEVEFTQAELATETATKSIDHPNLWAVRFSVVTNANCSGNNRVRVQLGGDISMTSFGSFPAANPVAGDPAWGFRAIIPYDHPGIVRGQDLRLEINYDGGTNSKLITGRRAKVLEDFS